jgi:hypothetical protein
MYATCIHCQKALGSNDAIEALPIGQRVAFDADKGRLWVVCRHCRRWNLTPFDERWEAVEQCERAFRNTRVRLSTDNIGLARLKDGTDLVRVGRPLRPEFAAWRYGDQFGVRRRQLMVKGLTVGGTLVAGGALSTLLGYGIVAIEAYRHRTNFQPRRIHLPDGRSLMAVRDQTVRLIAMPEARDGWGLEALARYQSAQNERDMIRIAGEHAMPLLRYVLPRINNAGASQSEISTGVAMIERAGGPEQFGRWALTQRQGWASRQTTGDTGDLQCIPVEARLAFEMATNEDAERRALEGELTELEAAWREAEEVAGIADRLLVPPSVDAKMESMRDRR